MRSRYLFPRFTSIYLFLSDAFPTNDISEDGAELIKTIGEVVFGLIYLQTIRGVVKQNLIFNIRRIWIKTTKNKKKKLIFLQGPQDCLNY